MSRAHFDCGEVRGDRLARFRHKDMVDVGGTIGLKDLLERLRDEELLSVGRKLCCWSRGRGRRRTDRHPDRLPGELSFGAQGAAAEIPALAADPHARLRAEMDAGVDWRPVEETRRELDDCNAFLAPTWQTRKAGGC
ncbi:MAG: hypothetical protein IH905_04525 [Proteobacteria bacterium]|nr:hypothetical protein [Pseudomonadota bacterium]